MKKPGQPSRGEQRHNEDAELFSSRDFDSENIVEESSESSVPEAVRGVHVDSKPAELFSEGFDDSELDDFFKLNEIMDD